jgi:cullin-associated NEDD8-dissociated protein 1
MGQFLAALKDLDPNVRRVALVAFNSAAHNKPSLVRDLLDDVLPQLYEETKIKARLFLFVSSSIFRKINNQVKHTQIFISTSIVNS